MEEEENESDAVLKIFNGMESWKAGLNMTNQTVSCVFYKLARLIRLGNSGSCYQ
jgi:hypothetical protein